MAFFNGDNDFHYDVILVVIVKDISIIIINNIEEGAFTIDIIIISKEPN